MVITGTREWMDYSVQAVITPHLVNAFGLAGRVQGLERYYALLLCEQDTVKLIKRLDGEVVLAEKAFVWQLGQAYDLHLTVAGNQISAHVNDEQVFAVEDNDQMLSSGGIALVCEEGRIATDGVVVMSAVL